MQEYNLADDIVFDKTLIPHRSTTARGRKTVLGLVTITSFCASLPFFFMGAWPVAGFFGLDTLLLYIAFRANMRVAQHQEQITLTYFNLSLTKISAKGQAKNWQFNPFWTRINLEEHEEYGVQRIDVVQGKKQVEVASFLGADEKQVFADNFKAALVKARQGKFYS